MQRSDLGSGWCWSLIHLSETSPKLQLQAQQKNRLDKMKRCPVLTKCAALGPSIKQLLASSTVLVVLLGLFERLLFVVKKTSVLAPLSLSI